MKSMLFSLALALAVAPLPATAAEAARAPTAAQVDALLEAMDIEASQRAMMAQMDASFRELKTAILGEDATAEDLARFDRMQAEQRVFMERLMTSPRMLDVYRDALRTTMDAGEVQAMTDFYRDPRGKSAMQKMPAMMAIVMREMQPVMIEMMEQSQRALESEFRGRKD